MTFVKDTYERFVSDYPFEFRFLDMDIQNFYQNEKRIHRLFTYFTILAVFIACLGLFGLASFIAEKRSKEIGIRKVLGASVSEILILLYWEFGRWVLISNIIALPVAYFVMRKWLENFVYRTDIGIWAFVLSAVTVFIIALISVSYQSMKAAMSNPVDAIKYE